MGIDVKICIRVEPTQDAMDRVVALGNPLLQWVDAGDGCVEINSMSRYFGPGYPRGHWPEIKAALIAIREAFPPGTVIEYGGDYREWGVAIDDELLADLDYVWADLGRA